MAWQKGPLPPGTWSWGAVKLHEQQSGFYFADFQGDHVMINDGARRIKPEEVDWYDNSIVLPPNG